MRYINADLLMGEVYNSRANNPHTEGKVRLNHHNEHSHFMKMIYDAPTTDVIEVVRCKDCKLRETSGCPIHSMNVVGVANMRAIIEKNGWKEVF